MLYSRHQRDLSNQIAVNRVHPLYLWQYERLNKNKYLVKKNGDCVVTYEPKHQRFSGKNTMKSYSLGSLTGKGSQRSLKSLASAPMEAKIDLSEQSKLEFDTKNQEGSGIGFYANKMLHDAAKSVKKPAPATQKEAKDTRDLGLNFKFVERHKKERKKMREAKLKYPEDDGERPKKLPDDLEPRKKKDPARQLKLNMGKIVKKGGGKSTTKPKIKAKTKTKTKKLIYDATLTKALKNLKTKK